jgi:hypothetical protein
MEIFCFEKNQCNLTTLKYSKINQYLPVEYQTSTPKNEFGWQMWRVFAFLATTIIGRVHELLINSEKASTSPAF